jgi:hypothetical protein
LSTGEFHGVLPASLRECASTAQCDVFWTPADGTIPPIATMSDFGTSRLAAPVKLHQLG